MNENVAEYLTDYIVSKITPDFGILIKGSWGCGKTYFVNNIIEKIDSQKLEPDDIIKISLYGVSSIAELNTRMYQAIHPFLSSKAVKYASAFVRTALKVGVNFDINGDDKSDGTISLGATGKSSNIEINKIKKSLIIIDDLERTNLRATEIFGYFSEYIISCGLKAIFIGHEDELHADNEAEKNKYARIKEKIIGSEFIIKPNIDHAIQSFVGELEIQRADIVIPICKDIMNKLLYENLRNLRQCLYNLKIIINNLPSEIDDKYVKDIVESFVVLYLQKCKGIIQAENVNDALRAYKSYKIDYATFQEKKKESSYFGISMKLTPVLLGNCWERIIFNGDYSNEEIFSELSSEIQKNAPTKSNALYTLMNGWPNYDKGEFITGLDKLENEVDKGTYLHPGEILHYLNLMCIFSRNGLIEKTIEEIKTVVDNYIIKHRDEIISDKRWDSSPQSYGGWGYSDDIKEIVEIRNQLKKISDNNRTLHIQKDIYKMIDENDFNTDVFCDDLHHVNGSGKFENIPILSIIGSIKFCTLFNKLSLIEQEKIVDALEERFGMKYSNAAEALSISDYVDIPILKEIVATLKIENISILYDPIAFRKFCQIEELELLYKHCMGIINAKKSLQTDRTSTEQS